MGKKIIVLNGSPRKKGNTSALVKAFTEGAESTGNQVTEFFLDEMNIHGCKGCFGGGKNPDSPCAQKDDMDLKRLFIGMTVWRSISAGRASERFFAAV